MKYECMNSNLNRFFLMFFSFTIMMRFNSENFQTIGTEVELI
jgi:hypothetical protein